MSGSSGHVSVINLLNTYALDVAITPVDITNFQNAAIALSTAFDQLIAFPTPRTLNTVWNFFVVNKDTIVQENTALAGIGVMDPSTRFRYVTIYSLFRQATNGLALTSIEAMAAVTLDCPFLIQFLQAKSVGMTSTFTLNTGGALVAGDGIDIVSNGQTTTVSFSTMAAGFLLGNGGTISAFPGDIAIGDGLVLNTNTSGVAQLSVSGVELISHKGNSLGYAGLDSSGKVPIAQLPDAVIGGLKYLGVWNATTNTPTLTSSIGTNGSYYKVAVAGTTALNSIASWNVGDTAIFNGDVWSKLDGITNEVISVAGKTGIVSLVAEDIAGLANSATTDTTNATNIISGTLSVGRLPISGVTAGTYGSTTDIPVLVLDNTGRVTSASTVAVSTGGGSSLPSGDNSVFNILRSDSAWANSLGIDNTALESSFVIGNTNTINALESFVVGNTNDVKNDAIGIDGTTAVGASHGIFGNANTLVGGSNIAIFGSTNTIGQTNTPTTNATNSGIFGNNNTFCDLTTNSFIIGDSNTINETSYLDPPSSTNVFILGNINAVAGNNNGIFGNDNSVSGISNLVLGDLNICDNMVPGDILFAYSIVSGYGNTANGTSHFIMGISNQVYSTTSANSNCAAFGVYNVVSGSYNWAIGTSNQICVDGTGAVCFAYGNGNIVNGNNSLALGNTNNIWSNSSSGIVAIGNTNSVDGQDVLILGANNTVTALQSNIIGNNCNVTANYSLTIGNNNTVSGASSLVNGNVNTVATAQSFVNGNFNTLSAPGSFLTVLGSSNVCSGNGSFVNGNYLNDNGNNASIILNSGGNFKNLSDINIPGGMQTEEYVFGTTITSYSSTQRLTTTGSGSATAATVASLPVNTAAMFDVKFVASSIAAPGTVVIWSYSNGCLYRDTGTVTLIPATLDTTQKSTSDIYNEPTITADTALNGFNISWNGPVGFRIVAWLKLVKVSHGS